jgi:hypothetical protein
VGVDSSDASSPLPGAESCCAISLSDAAAIPPQLVQGRWESKANYWRSTSLRSHAIIDGMQCC